MDASGITLFVGDDNQDRQYRSILSFDTSSLPDGAVITEVTLKVKSNGIVGTNPFSILGGLLVDVRKGTFSGDPTLQAQDFQAWANVGSVGKVPNSPNNSGWYHKTWTTGILDYINKQGRTQLRLRFSTGDNDNLIADYIRFYSGNATTTTYRPQLIVQYYVP